MALMEAGAKNEKNRAQNAHDFTQARMDRGGGSNPSGTWLEKDSDANGIEVDPVKATGLEDTELTSTEPVQQVVQALHLPSPSELTFKGSA